MSRLLRSPWVKVAFLLLATGGAVAAVVLNWGDIELALRRVSLTRLAVAAAASMVYVFATMLSWRSVMADLGAPLRLHDASRLFFVTQIGKYVPGGIWNVVAVGEMGRDLGVARRTSVSAMLVFWLVSVLTGAAVGLGYVGVTTGGRATDLPGWLWLSPLLVLMAYPPLLRKMLNVALRLARREALVADPTAIGLARASGWAVLGWAAAGAQVWLLAAELSDTTTHPTYLAALGGYALAWTAGFLVVFAPAGAGVREVVLASLFAGMLSAGPVVALVLLSRLLITGADLAWAGIAASLPRRSASPTDPPGATARE